MNRKNKHIFIIAVLLLLAGNTLAQNDRQYVIKKGDHLLAHVYNASESRWELQDVVDNTSSHNFSPNCLWYSSNNYNYYFMDGTTKMYLKAPLAPSGAITIASNPGTVALNNITQDYFFYDWDHGLARGIQHFGGGCDPTYNSGNGVDSECWEAVWVSYESDTWKMSSVYGYDPTPNAARFFSVSITEHPAVTTTVDENTGLADLVGFSLNYNESHLVRPTINDYQFATTPAYTTYLINESPQSIHNYWGDEDHGTATPGSENSAVYEATSVTYLWGLSGEGADYLSFEAGSTTPTSEVGQPTVYYRTPNTTGHKAATLTLTVTYHKENQPDVQQTSSATIMVNTPCQNPPVGGLSATVNSLGAIISWTPTAESYVVSWRKTGTPTWNSASVGNVNSYTITGLEYGEVVYEYKVRATCDVEPTYTYPTFTTGSDPGLLVVGAVFGGGRMADVGGKTEVVIINCDSIAAVFGGNDIAGSVADSSIIILGINASSAVGSYSHEYNLDAASTKVRVSDVYGGGNGYYAYNGSSFVPASSDYTSETVAVGASVMAMTQAHTVGNAVWTNNGTADKVLDFPSIPKTSITVTNDVVKVDSLFGGAKNAFLTYNDWHYNGDSIVINGGTILAVFGGNNFGGTQGQGKHYIAVNGTTTNLTANITNTETAGYGRTFGIRYLFGGGNKVYGSTTDVYITGGQCDTIFAGGNAADVYAANITVNCAMGGDGSGNTWDHVYSNAIASYSGGVITPKPTGVGEGKYNWDGINGIYNVRTLFGGNNMATFDSKLHHTVPTITLTSGSIGTVYGGGNSGDMWGLSTNDGTDHDLVINGEIVKYGTHVKMDSPTILIDILYGGCQMSNVRYGTWVELKNGHVGTVYGGCNVSGDVGSTRVNLNATTSDPEAYQEVYGGTWVVDDGGIVYKNLFAGGNGFYHCVDDYGFYTSTLSYTNRNYFGLAAPTHNETHVLVNDGARVKGNVYAGGNLARVGFDNSTVGTNPFPTFVGWASVKMSGGTVDGDVYGGGNMADVNGSNEVQVSGGNIGQSLYGGNDRMGKVAQISNRKLPSSYDYASDHATSLLDPKVYTYLSVTGDPSITNVYGGGNGDYAYFTTFEAAQAYTGPKETVVSCDITNQPIQRCTFVDIGIQGGATGGHIGTVYGGGDGVTVTEFLKVFLNVQGDNPIGYSNVGTIFGGNNKGDLELVADIVLLKGQVNTVYGGCNEGAMTAYNAPGHINLKTIGGYENIGSYVRLLESYDPDDDPSTNNSVTPNIKVVDAIYGGCRMNGVRGEDLNHTTYPTNSLVLVEGGNFSNMTRDNLSDVTRGIFGGSDISGTVSGWSRVAVNGSTAIVGDVYGGGNGNYDYDSDGNVYKPGSDHDIPANLVATGIASAPICANSSVDILLGQVGDDDALGTGHSDIKADVFGGGYGQLTETTGNVIVEIGDADAASAAATPTLYGDVYGGSALGKVNTEASSTNLRWTTVNFLNGTIHGNVYGGGLGYAETNSYGYLDPESSSTAIPAVVKGTVQVNVGSNTADADHPNVSKFVNIDGSVFGGNNLAGSPEGHIYVDVYRTAHTTANTYPSTFPDPIPDSFFEVNTRYALPEVYGGGNLAEYTGPLAHVHVHNCDNTIEYVYGGGNAADVPESEVTIDGGLVKYVFGGGNGYGTGNPGANIGNATSGGDNTLALNGGVMGYVFGGSNTKGMVYGETDLQFQSEPNCDVRSINELYGGGNQAEDTNGITLNVPCGTSGVNTVYGGSKLAPITGNVVLNVKGGTFDYVYGGSKGEAGTPANIDGNVTLNLEGGNIYNAFGGSNINGNITGNIVVNVIDLGGDCGLDLTNVYGGGNLTAYTPTNATITSPVVNVIHITHEQGIKGNVFGGAKGATATVKANPRVNFGYNAATMSAYLPEFPQGYTFPDSPRAYITGNVFGGGDLAAVGTTGEGAVVCNTEINVYNGEIVHMVVGGGNEAGVSGNTTINISGGQLCTSTADPNTDSNVGIYGGCNTSGTVGGNTFINITGTEASQTTIGSYDAVLVKEAPTNVHGGGYGQNTFVAGNVTVTFGDDSDIECAYPMLYGDIYGGSALGDVNTAETTTDHYTTTVNILNGTVKPVQLGNEVICGNIYGGGLGRKADGTNSAVPATVFGEVHVNIGYRTATPSSGLYGQATLIGCNVYGCNNQNGSPQEKVYVDIYQTAHVVGINTIDDEDYAILHVFGGGNRANYLPTNSSLYENKTNVYVHGCENTVKFLYGGGNAADCIGVVTIVEGGRFSEIFGGGNGLSFPANIGEGLIGLNVLAGHVNFLYEGCNKEGQYVGVPYVPDPPTGYIDCGELIVDSHYFGDNEAEHFGDMENIITCEESENFNFRYVYAGSRWAIVYGDIRLTVQGGNIRYLFGGSKGYREDNKPADVRRFPSYDEIVADINAHEDPNDRKYSQALLNHMGFSLTDPSTFHTELVGKGGNIELIIQGGTIGDVIAGCDELGNVDGKITVIIDGDPNAAYCPLYVGNVYGAGNETDYEPIYNEYVPTNPNAKPTPKVNILRGTIGGTATFGYDIPHPVLTLDGNVFGGGDLGSVTSNPKVMIGDGTVGVGASEVTVKGSVFGGCDKGNLTGNPTVVVVPNSNTLSVETPAHGTIKVRETIGNGLSFDVGEDVDIPIEAIPERPTSAEGYVFSAWNVDATGTAAGASVSKPNQTSTLFTMGTGDATLSATFATATAYQLTLAANDASMLDYFTVYGETYQNPVWVTGHASVTVVAVPASGYAFKRWTVDAVGLAGGASLTSIESPTTIFTMGDAPVTLTAEFAPTHTLNLLGEHCTFKVNGVECTTGSVAVAEGASVSVEAIPVAPTSSTGYAFDHWVLNSNGDGTISNTQMAITTFTMGTGDATLTAHLNPVTAYQLTLGTVTGGTFTVNGSNTSPVWMVPGTSARIVATPDESHVFSGWTIAPTDTGAVVSSPSLPTTTFTMGSANATLTPTFTEQ